MSPDLLGLNQILRVWLGNVTEEVSLAGHLRQVGAGLGMTEERF